jgi:hypothetical protein
VAERRRLAWLALSATLPAILMAALLASERLSEPGLFAWLACAAASLIMAATAIGIEAIQRRDAQLVRKD